MVSTPMVSSRSDGIFELQGERDCLRGWLTGI